MSAQFPFRQQDTPVPACRNTRRCIGCGCRQRSAARIVHRCQSKLPAQRFDKRAMLCFCLLHHLTAVLFKLFPAHPDDLFDGICTAAGDDQPQKILEGSGERIDIVFGAAFGICGEHHIAVLRNKAAEDAPFKADCCCADGIAEIRLGDFAAGKPDRFCIEVQALIFLKELHGISPSLLVLCKDFRVTN